MPRDIISSSIDLYYPTIVISDLHLGKRKVVEAGLLLEFLENIDCDTLILNGDIIDGWYLEKHRYFQFPEMHKRVLDALNKKAAQGTRVIFIPGNHDERLRYPSRRISIRDRLKREKPNFAKKIIFKDKRTALFSEIEFLSDMVLKDNAGRNMRILHGDIFDPPWVAGRLSVIGDQFYDALVLANTVFSKLFKKFNGGVRFSLVKLIKKNTKDAVGIIKNYEQAACDLPDHINGMICGHIHHAEVTDNNGKLYVNSGDWIESCTAAAQDEQGQWQILHWEEIRKELGLVRLISLRVLNPNSQYRNITRQQIRLIHYFWPARNRMKALDKGKLPSVKVNLVAQELQRKENPNQDMITA